MCPIEMYIKIIASIEKIINFIFSFLLLPSIFISLNSPKLLNPACFTNSSIFSRFNNFSSYSIVAFAMTKLTTAFEIPFCLFRYFSSPLEQALQVIPSIDKLIFFIINLPLLQILNLLFFLSSHFLLLHILK